MIVGKYPKRIYVDSRTATLSCIETGKPLAELSMDTEHSDDASLALKTPDNVSIAFQTLSEIDEFADLLRSEFSKWDAEVSE